MVLGRNIISARVRYIIFKRLYFKQLDKTFNSQANIITDIAFHFNHLIDSTEGVSNRKEGQ